MRVRVSVQEGIRQKVCRINVPHPRLQGMCVLAARFGSGFGVATRLPGGTGWGEANRRTLPLVQEAGREGAFPFVVLPAPPVFLSEAVDDA